MAIYQLFEQIKQEEAPAVEPPLPKQVVRGGFFSSFITRISFSFLLAADLLWVVYTFLQLSLIGLLFLLFLGKSSRLHRAASKSYLSLRRSLVCAIALLIGLFSPSFGMMVACTYFLMYDKAGIDEVIPAPLQSQFREFFQA